MACPLFLPSEPLAGTPHFDGVCAADPNASIPAGTLQSCCNPGYARGRCERASGAPSDAFRFLVRKQDSGSMEIAWSAERDHHPVSVGTLLLGPCLAENTQPLERQARVYAAHVKTKTLLRP